MSVFMATRVCTGRYARDRTYSSDRGCGGDGSCSSTDSHSRSYAASWSVKSRDNKLQSLKTNFKPNSTNDNVVLKRDRSGDVRWGTQIKSGCVKDTHAATMLDSFATYQR